MTRRLIGVLSLAGALMLSPGIASAAKKPVSTKVTIAATWTPQFVGYAAHGTLTAGSKACMKHRTLRVFIRRPADRSFSLANFFVAPSTGKWKLDNYFLDPGKYYATVDKKGICKAAKSKTITGANH
jgi:hypothetical protein